MTEQNILLIQRFYPNYREGLFDRLAKNEKFKLICYKKGFQKIITPSDINEKRYLVDILAIRIIKDFVLYPFLFFKLISLRPDTIVVEGGKNTVNNLSVVLYCKLFRKKYIVWDLGRMHLKDQKIGLLQRIYLGLQLQILKSASKIYTYNRINVPYFNELVPNKEVVPLGNTVDTEKIEAIRSKVIVQNDVPDSILSKELILLYIGALNEKKKAHDLGAILKNILNVGLIVIGEGEEKYKQKVLDGLVGIDGAFLGYKTLDDLPYYYSIADLVILPGLGGLTIPQSYMFGVPVMCSKADGTEEEIIVSGDTGLIFNTIDEARSFLTKMNKSDLKLMGEKGYTYVSSNFSIDSYYQKFYNAIG